MGLRPPLQLNAPDGVAVDAAGGLFIADIGNDVIREITPAVSVTIQTTTTIAWAKPASITYGTALSGTQLDATASVPGTFAYTPPLGTVLKAGSDQTLSVTFTPTNAINYTGASFTVAINVLPATPTITWANPAPITIDMPLSSTQLDATASWTVGGVLVSVAGTFTYTPALGTYLGVGNNQTLSVSFTPNDTKDFKPTTATATIKVILTTATFVEQDATTEGNWIKTYGTQGYEVVGNATSLPSYATVNLSGELPYTWTTTTTDPRALEDAGGTGRIAAAWYASTSFTVNVSLTDGQTHDLELYFLDWDTTTRSETVKLSNANTGAVL